MRVRTRQRGAGALVFGATGWLFADLLLAIAMMFLLADTNGQFLPALPTPTPLPTCVPVASPLPVLDLTPVPLNIPINPSGILSNTPSDVASAQAQVRQSFPDGTTKRAGLVLLFGGANNGDTLTAEELATAFYKDVLMGLGAQGFVFYPVHNVVYQAYHDLSNPPTTMEIQIYVFTSASQPTPVPNANTVACVNPTP